MKLGSFFFYFLRLAVMKYFEMSLIATSALKISYPLLFPYEYKLYQEWNPAKLIYLLALKILLS